VHRAATVALAVVGIAATAGAAPSPRTVPVAACRAAVGAEGVSPPPIPARLPALLTARAASKLRFFSDGFVTVLAPRAWRCAGVVAADGGESLSVFPAHQPNPLRSDHVPPNAAGVTVFVDYTGHGPGAHLVCSLFAATRAAELAARTGGCAPAARRETVRRTRVDVARFDDPPGVRGVGLPSGGANRAVGAIVYPQLRPEPESVTVSKVTCTAPRSVIGLCPTIVDDFVARAVPHG
jgi:hypothetical protein